GTRAHSRGLGRLLDIPNEIDYAALDVGNLPRSQPGLCGWQIRQRCFTHTAGAEGMVHDVLRVKVDARVLRYLVAGILVILQIEDQAEKLVTRVGFHVIVPGPLT